MTVTDCIPLLRYSGDRLCSSMSCSRSYFFCTCICPSSICSVSFSFRSFDRWCWRLSY